MQDCPRNATAAPFEDPIHTWSSTARDVLDLLEFNTGYASPNWQRAVAYLAQLVATVFDASDDDSLERYGERLRSLSTELIRTTPR